MFVGIKCNSDSIILPVVRRRSVTVSFFYQLEYMNFSKKIKFMGRCSRQSVCVQGRRNAKRTQQTFWKILKWFLYLKAAKPAKYRIRNMRSFQNKAAHILSLSPKIRGKSYFIWAQVWEKVTTFTFENKFSLTIFTPGPTFSPSSAMTVKFSIRRSLILLPSCYSSPSSSRGTSRSGGGRGQQ